MFQRIRIRSDEMGLFFRDGEFEGLLGTGKHWVFDPLSKVRVEVVSRRQPWLVHDKLDVFVRSGVLKGLAEVVDLSEDQRAVVWVDGRLDRVLTPGLYAYWTGFRKVEVEPFDARVTRFEHRALSALAKNPSAHTAAVFWTVARDHAGVLFLDGKYVETLTPGQYAFWRNGVDVRVECVDLRETTADVNGQEIMTADKVSLRLNAVVTYKVVDPRLSVSACDDVRQAVYRETQLALRAVVGGRELDQFLADKESVASEAEQFVRRRAEDFGLDLVAVGVRDVVLPGDMKILMNRVTEAKKAAEANLVTRREETAAIRSQANTAKLLEGNPTLMRLRELEVLEKIVVSGKLQVFLGEKGLADRVVNLL